MSGQGPDTPEFIRLARAKKRTLAGRRLRSATVAGHRLEAAKRAQANGSDPAAAADEAGGSKASSRSSRRKERSAGSPKKVGALSMAGSGASETLIADAASPRSKPLQSPGRNRRKSNRVRPKSMRPARKSERPSGVSVPGIMPTFSPADALPPSAVSAGKLDGSPVGVVTRRVRSASDPHRGLPPRKAASTDSLPTSKHHHGFGLGGGGVYEDVDDEEEEEEDPEFAQSRARLRSNSQTRADMVTDWESEWTEACRLHPASWLRPAAKEDQGEDGMPPLHAGNACMFVQKPGFLYDCGDTGAACTLPPLPELHLEDPDTFKYVYRDYFFGTDHELYVGRSPSENILVIINLGNEAEGINSFIMIIRKTGNARFAVPYANPQQLLWFLHTMEQLKPFKLTRVNNPKKIRSLSKQLKSWEDKSTFVNFKFGVIYCQDGQVEEEDVYCNRDGSDHFHQFLRLLGTKIKLKGHKGYRGGLKQHTGKESVYSRLLFHLDGKMIEPYAVEQDAAQELDEGTFPVEIMWHVSTMLPFSKRNRQQLDRKRHIGNDIVVILFKDKGQYSDTPLPPDMFASNFNHVFILVVPWEVDDPMTNNVTHYRVQVCCKEGVKPCRPFLPASGLMSAEELGPWILMKCINSERAAMYAPSFSAKMKRTNAMMIKQFLSAIGVSEPTSKKK